MNRKCNTFLDKGVDIHMHHATELNQITCIPCRRLHLPSPNIDLNNR